MYFLNIVYSMKSGKESKDLLDALRKILTNKKMILNKAIEYFMVKEISPNGLHHVHCIVYTSNAFDLLELKILVILFAGKKAFMQSSEIETYKGMLKYMQYMIKDLSTSQRNDLFNSVPNRQIYLIKGDYVKNCLELISHEYIVGNNIRNGEAVSERSEDMYNYDYSSPSERSTTDPFID